MAIIVEMYESFPLGIITLFRVPYDATNWIDSSLKIFLNPFLIAEEIFIPLNVISRKRYNFLEK